MNRGNLEEEAGPFSNTLSSNGGGCQFDVFLSFRGPDTRQGFTSYLYEELKRFGAITFIDNEDLPKGEKIKQLLHYMESSQIFVPIFSQNYGQSKWCLWEAANMVEIAERDLEKRRTIIPVFYRIHPCDVKDDGGLYQSAVMELQKDGKLEVKEVKKCIDALKTIGSISGFSLTDGNEVELVTSICKRVQMLLGRVPFGVQPIGIDSQIREVITMLEAQRNGVCIIGICGMGGIGKTTTAKAIYDKLFSKFDCNTSFIEDIREMANRNGGLPSIQKKLICDVLRKKGISIGTVDEGRNNIRLRLGGKRVLIILDNIVELDQLKALLGDKICHKPEDLFGTGSKIIVTTRYKDVLLNYGIEEHQIYYPQELKHPWPLKLFHRHAFMHKPPSFELLKLAEEAAGIAGGLPLVLEIFGSTFAGLKTTEDWIAKLEKLRNSQPKDILEKLRWSYDGLDDQQKCVFLDIACFLVGAKTKYVDHLWDDYAPRDAINVLQLRSLISVDDDDRFRMHDRIQEMGRWIANGEGNLDPCMNNRLCCTDEQLIVSMDSEEKRRVEGIILNMEERCTETDMSTEEFAGMSKLRLLHLNFVNFKKRKIDHFPKKLNWLRWRGCELESATFNGRSFKNLVILDLSRSNIHQLHLKNELDRLKVLDLSHCCFMEATPDFSCTPKLEKLFLDDCVILNEIHESICHLENLTNWSMKNCVFLEKLPQKYLCDLPKLVELNLQRCQRLQSLPRLPSSLRKLFLQGCKMLKVVHGFENLESIELLEMDGCDGINSSLMRKLLQGKAFTRLERLIISGLREGAKFLFIVPLCSSDRPLLLEQLLFFGDSGSPSSFYVKVSMNDMEDNSLVYETIFSVFRDMDNETYGGSCYSLPLSAYDDINLSSGISTPCSVWVSRIDNFPLRRVDIMLRSVNEWGGNYSKWIPADEKFTNLVDATVSRCEHFTLGFDVFLIYIEEDVGTYFIDNLYEALEKHGICTFKAKEGENEGEQVEMQLTCIERSLICMPIISKRFSQSKWLLDSIVKMVKCRKLIVPVYFWVHPSDIKALTVIEDFGTYLYGYENENQREIVEDWRKALEIVVDRCHYHFIYHTNRYMHELISVICDRISSMLNFIVFRIPPTRVCSHQKQVPMILSYLEKEPDSVCRIGICGPNGIGKTTIAKIIYNKLFHKFEFRGFIFDVGATARTWKGLMSLQQKLLNVVAPDDNACIETAPHGRKLIKQRLGHKRVLIVFDDADELDVLASWFIVASDLFGGGSKIIVIAKTSKNSVLDSISLDAIYSVDTLTDKKSFQLFACHAFEGRQPTLEIIELARKATKFAEGVPLCLAVLGSLFSSMTTKSEWGSILEKLPAAPGNKCIDKIVKLSIDALNPEQKQALFDIACLKKHATSVWNEHRYSPKNIIKFLEKRYLISLDAENRPMIPDAIQDRSRRWLALEGYKWRKPRSIDRFTELNPHLRNVFLDIACCLVGSEKEYAAYMWEDIGSSPNNAIKDLQDMSLISIDKEGRIQMDDLVRDVGRLMVKEGEVNAYMYSRIWNESDLVEALTHQQRSGWSNDQIECVTLSTVTRYSIWLEAMSKARVLHLSYCRLLYGGFVRFADLRWLQVNNSYVGSWLLGGAARSFEKLLVLQLHYCRMHLIHGHGLTNKVFKKLKVLELLNPQGDGIEFLDFSCMPSLVKLVIEDFGSLKVDDLVMTIGELRKLEYLRIRNCNGLEKLCGRIGKLSSLQTLDLRECGKLSELPQNLGDLIALRELILHNCESLIEIPNSIIKLDHLQTLDVSNCRSLQHMPQLPSHLIILDASSCLNLRTVADISNLQDLKTLKLHGCDELRNVPGWQNLKSLQSMQLPFFI